MDLLEPYGEDDKSSSTLRLLPAKSSASSVDYTALALSCATPNRTLARPLDHSLAFNSIYDQLWVPIYGPAHPLSSSGLSQCLRNQKLGSIEDASIESFLLDEQYNTFHLFGYASDPSAPSTDAPVGDLEALSLSMYNLPDLPALTRRGGGDEGQPRQTMETEGVGSPHLIPNCQRQHTLIVGRRGLFWDLDGRRPDGKVIWGVWISCGERCPKVYNIYYTEAEADQDIEEVDEHADYETCVIDLHNAGGLNLLCCSIKEKFMLVLFDLLYFISSFPPPATIVFVTGNARFAPFLRKVKEKGYLVLVISDSESASSAFRDVGLTLYDWISVIHGEGFFPLEERSC